MVLKKITFDNSVRYIPKSEQIRDNKQNTMKNKSILENKIEKFTKQ